MFRLQIAIPFLAVSALAAQVPVTPVPPATAPVAPRASKTPAPMTSVWAPSAVAPYDFNYDYKSYTGAYISSDMNLDLGASLAWQDAQLAAADAKLASLNTTLGSWGSYLSGGPVAWAQNDPADSLYRDARDKLNRGDYRHAADLFKSLPQKYPNSAYVGDAQYWQAFSLYRIGGTPELQEALVVLAARKPTETDDRRVSDRPAARTLNGTTTSVYVGSADKAQLAYQSANLFGRSHTQDDAAALAARIANVLSTRGLANDAAVKRALSAGGNSCDQEEQSVRAEALSALMQNDPATGRQMAAKILANRDECSVPLRRNALMVIANSHDDAAVSTLIPVAKSDPSSAVRMTAIEYLSHSTSDAAIGAVIDIARNDTSSDVKRMAARALSQSSSPRARSEVRTMIENNGTDEAVRLSAIDGFDRDRISADDAAWLRSLYTRTTDARVKERIISAVARSGGDAGSQWLLALVRNEDEPLESRSEALSEAGRTLDVATLGRMYDTSPERPIREQVIQLLSQRKEPAAVDKLVDVAKNGTDPMMRRSAISALARSKDPRASAALLQLVDH
ncbi:MAG TPA: HEAT repeat domain-containing protein [Gemmatimonadales bacterium]|jgi:HEAT repeat protein